MRVLVWFGFLWFLGVGVVCGEVPPDYRYRVEVLARGLVRPMEVEVASDGRVFFNEFDGRLRIYLPDSGEVVEAGRLGVFLEQENGFLGFALDPDFGVTGWIYLFYSPLAYEGQRLSRFRMDGDRLDLGSERVMLEFGVQRRRCCHHGGSVEFAPDGCLLVSTGDNTDPGGDSGGYAPIDEREDNYPMDAQKSSGNTDDLRGKILRIRPLADGGYEVPEGNLFPRDGSGGRPEIFVMGCRNPWRMSVDGRSGFVYWGDVGPDAWETTVRGTRGYDEINVARSAGNYGWPYFVGANFAYADYDFGTGEVGGLFDALRPENGSPNNSGARFLPSARSAMIYWPYGESEEFPMLGSGGRTACAGPVFYYEDGFAGSDGFPEYYDGCLLFWDWQRPFMKWARLDGEGGLVGVEDFTGALVLANEGSGGGALAAAVAAGGDGEGARFLVQRPVDADFGGDGCLYLLDYGGSWGRNEDSALLRVSYRRGNLAPVVRVGGSPVAGLAPLRVGLSGVGSWDPEGGGLEYVWRLYPGGEVVGFGEVVELVVGEVGDYVAALTVRDGGGLEAVGSVGLVVGNSRPSVRFVVPEEGDFFVPGEVVGYELVVEDVEDGSSEDYDELMGGRTFLRAEFLGGLDEGGGGGSGLGLVRGSGCFNCHGVGERVVGPSFLEVADRYRGVEGALGVSVGRVLGGSVGVWGEVPMLGHGQYSREEVERMVEWIFGLEGDVGGVVGRRGLVGEVVVPVGGDVRFGVLEAEYRDLGGEGVSGLVGGARVVLRSRRVEAEDCDGFGGLRVEREVLGHIGHGAWALFRGLNLGGVVRVAARVSCGGDGGVLEVRRGSVFGEVLASFVVVDTGGWGEWVVLREGMVGFDGWSDVVLVFVNPGKDALMMVDWVRFEREGD